MSGEGHTWDVVGCVPNVQRKSTWFAVALLIDSCSYLFVNEKTNPLLFP
jgi:hypothetical protein